MALVGEKPRESLFRLEHALAGWDRREPVKVGFLFSQTGTTAFIERTQRNAATLAIEEVNAAGGVDGAEVIPVEYDPGGDSMAFSRMAEKLLDDQRVPLIVGCYMSKSRQAVVPIVERRNALLAYPAPYEGFEYSPNVIYGGAVPNQHIVPLARHLMQDRGKRFYLVGTRYTFPIESNRVMMTLVAEQKGKVIAERYVPLEATRRELSAIVADIKTQQPDVVFCTVIGEAAQHFYQLCREMGLPRDITIASLTVTEAEVALMGADLATDHITAATYFQTVEGLPNRRFVASYRKRFGDSAPLNAMAETAYCVTHLMLKAAGACGSFDPGLLRAALAGITFDAPQGRIRLDAENNHFYLWPRIARVTSTGQFEILEEPPAAVKPDPYLVNHTLQDFDPLPLKVEA